MTEVVKQMGPCHVYPNGKRRENFIALGALPTRVYQHHLPVNRALRDPDERFFMMTEEVRQVWLCCIIAREIQYFEIWHKSDKSEAALLGISEVKGERYLLVRWTTNGCPLRSVADIQQQQEIHDTERQEDSDLVPQKNGLLARVSSLFVSSPPPYVKEPLIRS
jgi:hypothetical protein